jgi:hypothetical protein
MVRKKSSIQLECREAASSPSPSTRVEIHAYGICFFWNAPMWPYNVSSAPFRLGALIFSLLLFGGCTGGGDSTVLRQVSGKLTRNGKPVPNLVVHFDPAGKGRPSSATSDMKGEFVLKYDHQRTGITDGEFIVWVQHLPGSPEKEIAFQTGKRKHSPDTQAILSRYGTAKASPLRETIKADNPNLEVKLD